MEDDDDIPVLVEISDLHSGQPVDRLASEDETRKIPITILTGFLGAGKTTILSYILSVNHGRRIAVIENELSMGLGVESLIARSGVTGKNLDGFFELNNGCICCSVRDSLLSTLEQLSKHSDKFDYILIEMTGVANPGPVISSFWVDEGLHSSLKLDGIICVVDGFHIKKYLASADVSNDVVLQICYADRILISKCDLISAAEADDVEKTLREMNTLSEISRSSLDSKPFLDWILDIDGYSSTIEKLEKRGFFESLDAMLCSPCDIPPPSNQQQIHLASSLSTVAVKFLGKLQKSAFERYLDRLLYRSQTAESSSQHDNGKDGTTGPAPSMEIYRIKGVVHLAEEHELFILQGVYETFELKSAAMISPDNEERWNRLVIIGRNIDRVSIEKACLACCENNG
jgi:G3E family GTPase